MKSSARGVFLLVFFCFCFDILTAQDSYVEPDTTYQNSILYLPVIGSSPETGVMFGTLVVPQFKMNNSGPDTRSSSLLFSGIYTTKNQIFIGLVADLIFPEEKWVLNGSYNGNYFPNSYWGIGPATSSKDEIRILYTEISIEQMILRKIRPALFAGPFIRWNSISGLTFEDTDGSRLTEPPLNGSSGSTSVGFGFVTRSDKRDNNLTPTENHFIQFSFLVNPAWSGTTHPYTASELDTRAYIPLKEDGRSVLAFQALVRLTTGNPSFLDLSSIGGDRINRGYYNGRYRSQNSAQIQTEYRRHLAGRFGLSLFAATGEVWNRFDELTFENYKWTAGAGLRFNLNKQETTNIRVDIGTGKDTSGFYLSFGEAF